jgi:TonB family protein
MKYLLQRLVLLILLTNLVAAQTVIEGRTISGSENWSGTIVVRGDVTIAKKGRLMIDAGSKIYFEPGMDLLNSGKDKTKSEIIVNGVLIARGSIENKIIFSSNGEERKMGDWYGITISNSTQASIMDNVIVEYSFNGVSIKKSKTILKNSHFRYNYNAGIVVEVKSEAKIIGNILSENGYAGLICKLGAKPFITENLITLNKIGVVNLSMGNPNFGNQAEGEFYNMGMNRFFDNFEYNLYNHSANDIMAENNYWGSKDYTEIEKKNYGAKNNRRYGEILFDPILGESRKLTNLSAFAGGISKTASNTANTTSTKRPVTEKKSVSKAANDKPQDTLQNITYKHRSLEEVLSGYEEELKERPREIIDKVETEPLIDSAKIYLDSFLDHKEVIKTVKPVVRDKNRGVNQHGVVVISIVVGMDGFVQKAVILRGLNPYLDNLALDAAKKFQFKPGSIKGTPVKFSSSLFFKF